MVKKKRWTISERSFKWHRTRGHTLWKEGRKGEARRRWGVSGYVRRELNKREPREMWRLTVAINYPWHSLPEAPDYRSQAIHAWDTSKARLQRKEQRLSREVRELMKENVHPDWRAWVMDDVNVAYERVPYDASLIGEETAEPGGLRVEPEEYKRAMAAYMIKSGRWFKQATLEKWFAKIPGLRELVGK